MNTTIRPSSKLLVILTVLFSLTLSGCSGIAFSPAAAAANEVRNNIEPNVEYVEDSLTVHQTVKPQDDLAVVIMTFKQVRINVGDETCLYTYEVIKRGIGWTTKSGGGSCWTADNAGAIQEDIQVGAGQSSSSEPGDLGFSQVYGLVRNPEIINVKVTWGDDTQEEVALNNSTFVAFRQGLFNMKNIEGLNEQGSVIYSFAFTTAPGKQP